MPEISGIECETPQAPIQDPFLKSIVLTDVISYLQSDVTMERRRNEGVGEAGDPREGRRPMASSDTIPTCENPVTRPGIDPESVACFPESSLSSLDISNSLTFPGFIVLSQRCDVKQLLASQTPENWRRWSTTSWNTIRQSAPGMGCSRRRQAVASLRHEVHFQSPERKSTYTYIKGTGSPFQFCVCNYSVARTTVSGLGSVLARMQSCLVQSRFPIGWRVASAYGQQRSDMFLACAAIFLACAAAVRGSHGGSSPALCSYRWGKREIPEKTRRPVASSGTIPACEDLGLARPGIEPGSPWWEASRRTTQPPRPLHILTPTIFAKHRLNCNLSDPTGNRIRFAVVGGEQSDSYNTAAPRACRGGMRRREGVRARRVNVPHRRSLALSQQLDLAAPLRVHLERSRCRSDRQQRRATVLHDDRSRMTTARETGVPRHNPLANSIVQHDSHMQKSGVTRRGLNPDRLGGRLTAQPPWPRPSRVSMEQRRNASAGETGNPLGNPSTSGIVRHNSHLRKSGSDLTGDRTRLALVRCDMLTAQPPRPMHNALATKMASLASNSVGTPFANQRLVTYLPDDSSRGGPVDFKSAHFIKTRSPPSKANRVQSPAGSPDFCKRESCRKMPLVDGFSRRSPVSPAPSFQCRFIFTSITLIDSEDLNAKSRPNLFTHSLYREQPLQ
ncbi:hypothetical protein PR048_006504 [Dryococelus australis]|uniref:Uncharacterized protein n=1 Tax=Dryococelus australis TaxID=614101 RepID=A0ABQ9IDE4_9NEOP|nr:hypothetical protein PR048_006504 [Dryococelus australis]